MPITRSRTQRVVEHRQIAWFENIERQLRAGQQQERRKAETPGPAPEYPLRSDRICCQPACLSALLALPNCECGAKRVSQGSPGDSRIMRTAAMKAAVGLTSVAGSTGPQASKNSSRVLARRLVFPLAVLAHDRKQLLGRSVAVAFGVEDLGKLQPRLMIIRDFSQAAPQAPPDRPDEPLRAPFPAA
jgi:hypothetical protein